MQGRSKEPTRLNTGKELVMGLTQDEFNAVYKAYDAMAKQFRAEYNTLPDIKYEQLRQGMMIGAKVKDGIFRVDRITPSGMVKGYALDPETLTWQDKLVKIEKTYAVGRDLYHEGGEYNTEFKLIGPRDFERIRKWHTQLAAAYAEAQAEQDRIEAEKERRQPASSYAGLWNGHLGVAHKDGDEEAIVSAEKYLAYESRNRRTPLFPGTRRELVIDRDREANVAAVKEFLREIKARGSARMKEIDENDPRAKKFIIPLREYLEAKK